jgi:hypothetical protein
MTLEPRTDRSSRALRFLTRLLRLVVASVMWVLLLVATALARATSAMLALFLDAEAAGHKDMVAALGELSGRGKKLEGPPAGRQPVPEIMESRWAERKQTAA